MNWILLVIFGASCLVMIIKPLRQPGGYLHFPVAAGCGAFGFLFLQAIGVTWNGDLVPADGLTKTLIMCILCNAAAFIGWSWHPPEVWQRPVIWKYPMMKVYWAGVALLIVGAVGTAKLVALEGGLMRSLSVDNQVTDWSGMPVAYLFFAMFNYPGIVLMMFAALRMRDSLWRFTPAVPFLLLQIAGIAFKARRTPLISLTLTILCVLYFARRYVPPKLVLIGLALAGLAAVYIFPLIRGSTDIGADRSQLQDLSVQQTAQDLLSGTSNEFWGAVYLIQITDVEHECMMGAGYYNGLIHFFVPKLLIGGADAKARLFLNVPTPGEDAPNRYGWTTPSGFFRTGPASVFVELSWAGALLYWCLGRFMRYLWEQSLGEDNLMAQSLYSLFLVSAVAALTSDFTGAIYTALPTAVIAPAVMLWMIRTEKRPSDDIDLAVAQEGAEARWEPGV